MKAAGTLLRINQVERGIWPSYGNTCVLKIETTKPSRLKRKLDSRSLLCGKGQRAIKQGSTRLYDAGRSDRIDRRHYTRDPTISATSNLIVFKSTGTAEKTNYSAHCRFKYAAAVNRSNCITGVSRQGIDTSRVVCTGL